MRILNLYARTGYPEHDDEYLTSNSADFHAHLGFSKVGEFRNCGYKFGRWYHMICMEKLAVKNMDFCEKITARMDVLLDFILSNIK